MKKLVCLFGLLMAFLMLSAGISSCSDEKDEPEPEIPIVKQRLVLIYAIAANSLNSALPTDLREIAQVAPKLDLRNNIVLVYSVDYSNECKLRKLAKNDATGLYEYQLVKTFPELPLSTSPERISEVLNYINDNYDYPYKGLILWSHATGWIPSVNGSTPAQGKKRTFGQDKYQGVAYETDINELADAIPGGVFDFIWFDCCYMANIETVFQLRDKTDFIGGYTEEIAADGMPYNLTMPYFLKKVADLEGAASAIYEYYDYLGYSAPVSVVRTEKLEPLAEIARGIIATCSPPNNLASIQNYTRPWLTEQGIYFYDMGQLLESYSGISESQKTSLQIALAEAVPIKFLASYSWPGPVIDPRHFSGLSMHNYIDNASYNESYYRTLDWYKATRN